MTTDSEDRTMRHAFALSTFFLSLLLLAPAWADEPCSNLKGEEKEQYVEYGKQASAAYRAKDYAGAVRFMVLAMEICDADPNIQYNLARAYQQAGNCNMAMHWFERLFNANISADLRQKAADYFTKLEVECSNSARISIDCSNQGVRVFLGDDPKSYKCPYTGRLGSGNYRITAELEGHQSYVAEIRLVAGENNRILIPALKEVVVEVKPTTGTLRVQCKGKIASLTLTGDSVKESIACESTHQLPPGIYRVAIPNSEQAEDVEVRLSETVSISISETPDVAAARSGFFLGLRANPSIGFATGTLYDKNNDGKIGLELDGVQPSLPTFAIAVEIGYAFTESFGAVAQARIDLTNFSTMGAALFRWIPWYGKALAWRLDVGLGGGSIVLPVEIADGQRPLARSGPLFAALGTGLAWRMTPLLSLVGMVEGRVGMPDLSVPIDLSLGIEVQF